LVSGNPAEPNCPNPTGVALGNGTLFVACEQGFQGLAEINATTLAFEGILPIPIALGLQSGGIAYDPITNCVYVATFSFVGLSIYSILTGYNLTTDSWGPSWSDGAGGEPGPLAYDAIDHRLYELSIVPAVIYGFDPVTGAQVAQIGLGSAPRRRASRSSQTPTGCTSRSGTPRPST
jgi:DNA-binding beta-propeller fold protein YncE